MKKILLCGILALAAGGMAFGQWPDGFSVAGQVRTGLRANFLGGTYWENALDKKDRGSFSFWHDDSGNRAQLDMKYEQENFGLRIIPRWSWVTNANDSTPTPSSFANSLSIPVAFGWLELLDDKVRITAGRVDNAVWYSPDAVERHYSNGGFRIEVKPIEGLNFGWALLNRDYSFPTGNFDFVTHEGDQGLAGRIGDVFAASSFGAKYSSDAFTFAAGLELRPENADRRSANDDFGFSVPFIDPANPTDPSLGVQAPDWGSGLLVGGDETAVNAYAGVQLKPVEALTIKLGVDSGNLDIADKAGYLWLNEYFEYSLGGVTPWLEMHQVMDISKTEDGKWKSPDDIVNGKDGFNQTPIHMEFIPGLDFDIADGLSGYVSVPVYLFDKVFEIGVKPGVDYTFGPGLAIGCYYKFTLTGTGYDVHQDNDPAIRNTVQVKFSWTF